jgi:hypothetical protein
VLPVLSLNRALNRFTYIHRKRPQIATVFAPPLGVGQVLVNFQELDPPQGKHRLCLAEFGNT